MVTSAKEVFYDPTVHLGPELDALLLRLTQTDETKWLALAELGLDKQVEAAKPKRAKSARKGGAAP